VFMLVNTSRIIYSKVYKSLQVKCGQQLEAC